MGRLAPPRPISSTRGLDVMGSKVIFDFDASWLDLTYGNQRWNQGTFQQALDYNIEAIDKLDLVDPVEGREDDVRHRSDFHNVSRVT